MNGPIYPWGTLQNVIVHFVKDVNHVVKRYEDAKTFDDAVDPGIETVHPMRNA